MNRLVKIVLLLFVITVPRSIVNGNNNQFIGFDCTSLNANVTSISRNNIAECQPPQAKINATKTNIQLLQLDEISHHPVKQCKVSLLRQIFYCGAGHHAAGVEHGLVSYVMSISRDACTASHLLGTLTINNKIITNLKVNETIHVSTFLAGRYDQKGYCETGTYIDEYGTYENVVVQANIDITLAEYYAETNMQTNKIKLLSGKEYDLQSLKCLDPDEGQTFWNPVIVKTCQLEKYSKLYDGVATKILTDKNETLYSINLQTTSFTVNTIGHDNICFINVIRTDHPKLFVVEATAEFNPFKDVATVHEANIDFFKYVNSKLVHIEQHIRFEVNEMYERMVMKRCALEKQILRANLALATLNADHFALQYYGAPGHTAIISGEVIHLIECIPVSLKIRQTEKCYDKIPVLTRSNDSLFLAPVTRILSTQAAEIECSRLTAPQFIIHGTWYVFIPQAKEVPAPITLTPDSNIDWEYKSLKYLMTSGIYTMDELHKFTQYIKSVQHQSSIITQVTRYITNNHHDIIGQGFSLDNLMQKADVEHYIQTLWNYIKDKIMAFGDVCAFCLGCFTIIKLSRAVIKTIIGNCDGASTIQAYITRILLAIINACANGDSEQHTQPPSTKQQQKQLTITNQSMV